MEKVRNIAKKVGALSGYTPYWGIPSKELKKPEMGGSVFFALLL